VATALGIFLGLAPLVQIVVLPVFAATLAISRYVSLASLVAAAVTPLLLIVFGYAPPIVAAGLVSSALIAFRHRDNMRRLRFGTEAQIGRPKSSPAESGLA
jgi:glycerol-3-phosphate acyltransferase PlsY